METDATLTPTGPQDDLPNPVRGRDARGLPLWETHGGEAWRCGDCGTRLRRGQPHRAVDPVPHATLETLFVYEEARP